MYNVEAKYTTVVFLEIISDCIHPEAKLCAEIILAINFHERPSHCVAPVVDVANFLIDFHLFWCNKSICAPNDKISDAIGVTSCHYDCRNATITPAEQRVFIHS